MIYLFRFTKYRLQDLFIINHLSLETIKYGRILYHDVKSNSIANHKAIFNIHTNKYELREITENKTNWSKPSLSPTGTKLKTWT